MPGAALIRPDATDDRSTYISPDIMYFRGDRYAQIDPYQMIRILPDLVVEVLSPSTDEYDLVAKRRLYERFGVPHYWIADTQRHTVRECILDPNGQYVERVVAAGKTFEPALFPGLQIDLRRVFA